MSAFENALVEGGWDFRRALHLAELAEASYAKRTDLEFTLDEDMGLNLIDYMPLGASQGFVASGRKVIVLSFSGTNQLTDWLTNLRISRVSAPWGEVHRGFKRAFDNIEEQASSAAERARREGKTFWITGHSLGGALAHIAGHALFRDGDKTGLATFGQPRTVKLTSSASELTRRMPLGYHRMVHGSDIVTRVPPNLNHTGDLVTLGRRRRMFGTESSETEAEDLPALDETEFAELQARLEAISGSAREADRSVEGLIPGIKDHKMSAYVAALRAVAPTESSRDDDAGFLPLPVRPSRGEGQRFSGTTLIGDVFGAGEAPGEETGSGEGPNVGRRVVGGAESSGGEGDQKVALLLRLVDPNWTAPSGMDVLSRSGSFVTAMAPLKLIKDIEGDNDVKSVEINRPGGFPELVRSVPFVKGKPVQRPDIKEAGSNALIGVIDTGIDVLHEAFADAAGTTRIVAIWDQLDDTGPSPKAIDPSFDFDFGTLHMRADIEAMRSGSTPIPDWLRDPQGHGTHVAGIAAGRAVGTLADGIAPEAGLAVVIPAMDAVRDGDPLSLGYSVSHINALQFLRHLAGQRNSVLPETKPIAINVSLGMNAGAHDGQTLLEAAFDSITSQGTDPGIAIVKSAGNERGYGGHAHVDLALGRVDVAWHSRAVRRDLDYLEAWFDNHDRLEFVLRGPGGEASAPVNRGQRHFSGVIDGNLVNMKLRPKHPDNGDSVLYLTIQPDARDIRSGVWTLEARGQRISADTLGLHVWAERTHTDPTVQFISADETVTLSVPGTAEEIITVGATDLADPFPGLLRESSYGPTRRNAAKPEISAPGHDIVSAMANQSDRAASKSDTGTSFAAPHVTGAIALAFSRRVAQQRRQFNTQQVRAMLTDTAQNFSGRHHPGFGYGILDIAAFLVSCDEED